MSPLERPTLKTPSRNSASAALKRRCQCSSDQHLSRKGGRLRGRRQVVASRGFSHKTHTCDAEAATRVFLRKPILATPRLHLGVFLRKPILATPRLYLGFCRSTEACCERTMSRVGSRQPQLHHVNNETSNGTPKLRRIPASMKFQLCGVSPLPGDSTV